MKRERISNLIDRIIANEAINLISAYSSNGVITFVLGDSSYLQYDKSARTMRFEKYYSGYPVSSDSISLIDEEVSKLSLVTAKYAAIEEQKKREKINESNKEFLDEVEGVLDSVASKSLNNK